MIAAWTADAGSAGAASWLEGRRTRFEPGPRAIHHLPQIGRDWQGLWISLPA
jgi:hypothetical protein